MHFKDFDNYNYQLPLYLTEVQYIGWIDNEYPFEKAFTNGKYIDKLVEVICGTESFNAVVNKIRGFHPCNICGQKPKFLCAKQNRWVILGSSEIWIPSNKENIYYASPSMIIHYIQDHLYSPPKEFLDAVDNIDLDSKFDGEEIYKLLLKKYMEGKI